MFLPVITPVATGGNLLRHGESGQTYLVRRLGLVGIILAILVIAILLFISIPGPQQPTGNRTVDPGQRTDLPPPPIYEREAPPPPVAPPKNDTNVPKGCEYGKAPVEKLGCLELNADPDIFDAYGLNMRDTTTRDLIDKVEYACDTDASDGAVDRDCIVATTLSKSANSWVCQWECLEDMQSCENYKAHLAVAVLRRYVPPTDVFVGRTADFDFFMFYNDGKGKWMQPQFVFTTEPAAAVYNDVYHAGPITEVVFPEILEVAPGEEFCFSVYAPRDCTCEVEVNPFEVGECPQLPADLRGICFDPTTKVNLWGGRDNRICFIVSENATEEFYTYDFTLSSVESFKPAGNAFIKAKSFDCCVNASFKGFLSIAEEDD